MDLANSLHKKRLPLSFIIMLLLITPAIPIAAASPATRVYVNPLTSVANPGDMFTVTIEVEDVIGLFAWEFFLRWDPSILYTNDTLVTEGWFLNQFGTFPTTFVKSLKAYYMQVSCVLQIPVAIDGSGTLAEIQFEVRDTGLCDLELYDTSLRDINGAPISHTSDSGFFHTTYPRAEFTYTPEEVYKNDVVTFNASASYDPDGTIVSYDWDFGDGNTDSGMIVTHAYTAGGTYTARLTVTDNDLQTDIDEAPIRVITLSPVASFTYSPPNPVVDRELTFDASASYDPDGTIVSYDWDFGDGNTDSGMIVTHAYTVAGTFTVTLTVTDIDNKADTTYEVLDVPYPGVANLVKRSAWPARRHFDQSRYGQYNTLYGKVGNLGMADVLVKVIFTIYDEVGEKLDDLSTEEYLLTVAEGTHDLSVDFDTYAHAIDTKYYVEAQCWFDSDHDGILESAGEKIKPFSFAVVP